MNNGSTEHNRMTVGLDLGDKYSHICLLDTESGDLVEESRLRTPPKLSADASAMREGSG